jgi:Ulp1 family protease catalytic subunit
LHADKPPAKRHKGVEDASILKRCVKIKDVHIETALNFLVLCRAEETATMFPGTLTSLEPGSRPPQITAAKLQGRRRFLLPAWVNENHWVLLIVERSANTIDRLELYNSLPDPATNTQVERMARAFISTFFTEQESSSPFLRLRPRLTPRQENNVDCGLYVFITAAYLEAGVPLPTTLNIRL